MKITMWDIEKWLDDFMKAKRMLDDDEKYDKTFLKNRMDDGIYLATLVESMMALDEPDGVIERAKMRQI